MTTKIIQRPLFEKASEDGEEQEPFRKTSPFTKILSLIYLTEMLEKDLEVGGG